jgi:hypothetical protein
MDVPELVANGRKYVTDEAKAEVLMDTFFPVLPLLEERDPSRAARGRVEYDIRWPPFTNYEVERDKAVNLFYLARCLYGDGLYNYRE